MMMKTRREFVRDAAVIPLCLAIVHQHRQVHASMPEPFQKDADEMRKAWFMPDEGAPHECTWMSFGASRRVWGNKLINEARKNLATIAQTIAEFEPVVVCVRPTERELAIQHFEDTTNIEFLECPLDNIWIRDSGAVFVRNEAGEIAAVDFHFNGWGEKQSYQNDARVAGMMARESDVSLINTDVCLEGGGIEVDGQGTAIITESCVLNPNRNSGWSKNDCESELRRTLGIRKVIWLPGVRDADITDGHTDFYARFASPGVVIAHYDPDETSPENELTLRHLEILRAATDARGDRLKVVSLEGPSVIRQQFANDDFCAGYVNFYVCNEAVIAMEFGDRKTDRAAREKLQACFPDRQIKMLNIDGIAAGGGGIHCVTQQQPRV